jgi:transposase
MIRIDAIWLATEPLDMRAGADTILTRVVKVFASARPHHAYLYDGFGVWLATRRLNKGHFVWADGHSEIAETLNPEQLRALVIGLPWQTLAHDPRAVGQIPPGMVTSNSPI